MKAEKFEQSNMILKAGDNPDTYDMPACRAKHPTNGRKFTIGKFTLSDEERERFLETGELWICIMGGWPPMLPTFFNPFDEHGFIPHIEPRGVPDIKYREEIDKMLKDIFSNPEMQDERWYEFVEYLNGSYPLENISNTIDKMINSGQTKEIALLECKKTIYETLIEKNSEIKKG